MVESGTWSPFNGIYGQATELISLQAPTFSLTTVRDLIALKLHYISMQLLLPPV